jgi:hypothetical protein
MASLTILIIRHAEKPDTGWPGPGLNANGVPDDKSLVIRGWQRAGAWAALFAAAGKNSDYPQPSLIYAANPDAVTGDEPSQRPFQTVTPLASRLGLVPDTTHALGQENQLADTVVKQASVVLIAWEHHAIINALVPAIIGGQSIPGIPAKWSGERFDVVFRLDRQSSSEPWSFRQLFPCLLSGDSAVPMS